MAEIGELNASTKVYWDSIDAQDIVNKASPLCWKLMTQAAENNNWMVQAHELVPGGQMIKVPLAYGVANSGDYGPDVEIDVGKKKILDAARFGWGAIYSSQGMTLDEITQNNGESAVINLVKTKVDSIVKGIRTKLANKLVGTATGSYEILGAGNLFNTSTSTEYGAIAEANVANWKANVITTQVALTFEVMQLICRTPGMGSHIEALPNFFVTTTALKDGYELSQQPQQRHAHEPTLNAGWQNIEYKTGPIVADPYYDDNLTGYLDAFNMRFLFLKAHSEFNFTDPEWVSINKARQPDTLAANSRFQGQFYTNNRQMHVRHTNLSAPA